MAIGQNQQRQPLSREPLAVNRSGPSASALYFPAILRPFFGPKDLAFALTPYPEMSPTFGRPKTALLPPATLPYLAILSLTLSSLAERDYQERAVEGPLPRDAANLRETENLLLRCPRGRLG